MEEPSTIRRAGTDISQTPYGGDSLGGQTVNETGRRLGTPSYLICSQFAICSFRAGGNGLFQPLVACFEWPVLKFTVAWFEF
jgi:hypothetical protein